jgi:uncharacterized protein
MGLKIRLFPPHTQEETMKYYFMKLNPPRPTFSQDMSPEERGIMQRHVAYWTDKMEKGLVLVFGPVLDPKGTYGVGVVAVESETQRDELVANDPANGLNRYEFYPMMAVVPKKE